MHNDNEFHPSRFVAPAETVRRIQQRYVEYFPRNGEIADLGCGEGVFLELLKSSQRNGLGVDITESLVQSCTSRGLKAVRQDVFEFLDTHKKSFDGIFASHLIEHFSTKDALKFLRLATDALRPDGRLVLMTPSYHDLLVQGERFWLDISHVRPYPILLLEAMFEHLGLDVIDKGYDRNTRMSPGINHPRSFFRHFMAKIRFGKYYDVGDAFIVGRKKT